MPTNTSAFIVHIVVTNTDPNFLADLADDLASDLTASGYDVDEVRPWARQEGLGTSIPSQQQTPLDSGVNVSGPFNPFGQ